MGAQARCQGIPNSPLRALRASGGVLALPPADRTSGQSEITLSPSRCVQSKLQFKSSCQTLFSPFSLPPTTCHRRLCRSRSLFRQPELEIPKIVLHRPSTNSAVPQTHARTKDPRVRVSTLSFRCVSVYAVDVRYDRASELLHSWIEG